MDIRLFKPSVGKEEIDSIKEVFDISWLGLGEKVSDFEKKWSDQIGIDYSVALNSATAALHLSLALFKFGHGKKVMMPSMTFASTATAAIYNNLDPVFVDCYEDSLTMDIDDLKSKWTSDCVAIIPVHYGGEPCDMEEIMSFAKIKNMKVIEDCAHTQGGVYKGKPLGSWGDIGCFSFEEKKGMTTGDGGMVCSNNKELLEPLKSMRWVGIDKDTWKRNKTKSENNERHWYYEISLLGYKYNMNNLAAAVGLAQLKKLDNFNNHKSKIIQLYLDGIKNIDGIEPLLPYSLINNDRSSYWLFGVRCEKRDELIKYLTSLGISTGVHFTPLNIQPFFSKYSGETPMASKVYKNMCTLPLHMELTVEEVDYVVSALRSFSLEYIQFS